MADERYQWLDQETAERLLRGEQVEAIGDHAQHQGRRLADALDAVRTPGAGPGQAPSVEPLRGEEAALAAFRKARDGGGAELLPTVRITAPAPRPARWGRPVRWGLAASLAGFAVGGVAVAAGTGVLPMPFGDRAPAPASSVSAAVTPGPLVSDAPTGGDGATMPEPPPSAPGTGPTTPPSSGTSVPTGGTGHDETAHGGSSQGGEWDRSTGTDRDGSVEQYRRTVEACRDYRTGRLDEDRRRRLEDAANGADRIKRFCDRVLSGGTSGNGASDGGQDPGSGGDAGGGDGGGDGDGDPGGDDDSEGSPAPAPPAFPAFPIEPAELAPPVKPAPPAHVPNPAMPGPSLPGPSLPGAPASR
ncbi:hypothetical protein [Streptomyces sp. NPDC059909]|uniref:hypothetical protein n=1 Tax=Streptomyces sp. NPDC059909 TaxID=3346998 RepID=UPI00366830D9